MAVDKYLNKKFVPWTEQKTEKFDKYQSRAKFIEEDQIFNGIFSTKAKFPVPDSSFFMLFGSGLTFKQGDLDTYPAYTPPPPIPPAAISAGSVIYDTIDEWNSGTSIDIIPSNSTAHIKLYDIGGTGDINFWNFTRELYDSARYPEPILEHYFDNWELRQITNPSIQRDGDIFNMVYASTIALSTWYLGAASSYDCINWKRYTRQRMMLYGGGGSFDQAGHLYGSIIKINNAFWTMYAGKNVPGIVQFGAASSTDMKVWTKVPPDGNYFQKGPAGAFDDNGISFPTLYKDSDSNAIWMFYNGDDSTKYSIGAASSTNFRKWTRVPGNESSSAVLYPDNSARFDGDSIADGMAITKIDDIYWMYYGATKTGATRIGVASASEIGVNWTRINGPNTLSSCLTASTTLWDLTIRNPSVAVSAGFINMMYAGASGGAPWLKEQLGFARASTATPEIVTKQNNGNSTFYQKGKDKFDKEQAYLQHVVKIGDDYRMYYTGERSSVLKIGGASSTDGISWTRLNDGDELLDGSGGDIFDDDGAFSPFVIYENDEYYMWYSGTTATTTTIGAASSTDGISWTKLGQILDVGAAGNFDASFAGRSSLIKRDNIYWLYYSGHSGSEYAIGAATSTDKTTWVKMNSGNPILSSDDIVAGFFDAYEVLDPYVIEDGDYLRMFYAGNPASDDIRSIGTATSSDGINWTREYTEINQALLSQGTASEFDNPTISNPVIIKDGNTYKLWYSGSDDTDTPTVSDIGYVVLDKGRQDMFKQNDGAYVLTGGSLPFDSNDIDDPYVLLDGSEYWMFYAGKSTDWFIGTASSTDRVSWTKINGPAASGSVLSHYAEANEFDKTSVRNPCVINDDDGYWMWYAGSNTGTSAFYKIGVASSTDKITWTRIGEALSGGPDDGWWDRQEVRDPNIIKDDDGYWMWYTGRTSVANTDKIGVASSTDKVIWTKISRSLTGTQCLSATKINDVWDGIIVEAPAVFKVEDNNYLMYYSGQGKVTGNSNKWRIGSATSSDKVVWHKRKMEFGQGVATDFDNLGCSQPTIIKETNKPVYRLWYTGENAVSADAIGYTSNQDFSLTGTWDVNIDSLSSQTTWGAIQWATLSALNAGSIIKVRARSESSSAALTGATWSNYIETSGESIVVDNNRWLGLQIYLERTSNSKSSPLLSTLTAHWSSTAA